MLLIASRRNFQDFSLFFSSFRLQLNLFTSSLLRFIYRSHVSQYSTSLDSDKNFARLIFNLGFLFFSICTKQTEGERREKFFERNNNFTYDYCDFKRRNNKVYHFGIRFVVRGGLGGWVDEAYTRLKGFFW